MKRSFIMLWVTILPIALLMSQNTAKGSEQLPKDTTVQTVSFDTDIPEPDVFMEQATARTTNPAPALDKIESLFNVKTVLIMTIVLLFIIVAVGYFLHLQHKEIERIKNSIKRNADRGNTQGMSRIENNLNIVLSQVDQLQNIVTDLKEKVEQLQTLEDKVKTVQPEKTEGESIAVSEQISVETNDSDNIHEKISEIQNIFFPSPYSDMIFSGMDASDTKDNSSIYVVNYDKNKNSGELKILNDAKIERALNSPDMYLEPVCEYLNEFNSSKKISVIEPGSIRKDGEHWIVTKKIKIEFK